MSQARVTDFFSQRKKGFADPERTDKRRGVSSGFSTNVASTRIRSGRKKDVLCSSSVHEEFVRVIDEAVGRKDGECVIGNAAKETHPSPQTPKRTSADAEFDLGAAVSSTTADHSTAKKRRQVETVCDARAKVSQKSTKGKARKKLVLAPDTQEAAAQPPPAPTPPDSRQNAESLDIQINNSIQVGQDMAENTAGLARKALCKDEISTLKSRLQRIRKHADEVTSTASHASGSTSSSYIAPAGSAPNNTNPSLDAKILKFTVARAKELADKAHRRKGESESKHSETQTHDSAKQPAYTRYHTITQATPQGLSLPYHYKVLAEMFRNMDTVVAMLYNRCETATLTKIKRGVQDMMHKRFEESHVGQIKTVFPEAYKFRQEKNIPTFNSSMKKGSYQLTVEPVILSEQNEAHPVLSASCLLERRRIFHLNLVSIVRQHHKVFLSSLVPPVSVPDDKLTRWHPRFNVDTVEAIEASLLPQPPHTEILSTAQHVLDKARSLITPKMEKALVSLAMKTEDKAIKNSPQNLSLPQASAAPAADVPAALKGVSHSLLDRIRTKEVQKLQAALTRNPVQEERLLMMSRLPELARILRNVFVTEKKPALIMEVACNRMVASYRSALSTGEMEKHIRLLAEVVADWLSIHPIRKDLYLKLNKNMELNIIVDKLNSRLREEERL